MQKKKRIPLIIGLILLFVGIAYSGTWLYFYNFKWISHVKNSSFELQEKKDDVTKETIYSYKDNLGDTYYISVPSFGIWDCHVATCSTMVFDEAKPITDKDGNMTFESYVQNGSDFICTMIASFNLSGDIEVYRFNVSPYPESSNDKYASSAVFLVSANGDLKNRDELSDKEYAIYQDVHPELERFINKTNEVFQLF
ncbi:MAG: hypothetical protein K2K89_04915 [Ruminococcus sp.]|nr:hypothetical protein [Ruminococcus sp.]